MANDTKGAIKRSVLLDPWMGPALPAPDAPVGADG